MGEQDLEDALPNPLFAPALIATGHRRPRPEALGQFAPRRAGAYHPEHAFHHQTMIDGRTARLRLLRWQEGTQLLPMLLRERWESQHPHGSWWIQRDGRGLTCAPQHVEALCSCLVLASKARPVQPPTLLFLGLAQRVQ